MNKVLRYLLYLSLILAWGCSSYQQFQYITEEFEIPAKVYRVTYHQAWQAVLQLMKTYDLALQDQEAGIIKTRWIDNTTDLNFADSFGSNDTVKAAKFKVIVNVIKGFRGTQEVAKVTIYKRQLVEQDFLQGWKEIPSDGIFEKTTLYRINQTLKIETRLQKIEDAKNKKLEKEMF